MTVASRNISGKKPATENTVILTDRFRRTDVPLQADQLEPGTHLDQFEILQHLGTGGMGSTYKALDTQLDRIVALKVIADRTSYRETLSRYLAEVQAQARVNSPFVTTLYGTLQTQAGPALVMEFLEGRTLDAVLTDKGRFTVDEAHDLFQQLLAGVAEMHRAGVVHRDLKPSNIFITKQGQIKIMDFGIASADTPKRLPGERPLIGTLLYIPPEQVNGKAVDQRSDIYTLGVTLYEMITGRLPFEHRRRYALLHAHVQENPGSPGRHQRMPKPLEQVIMKAIRKEPDARFQTAAEFAHELAISLNRRRRGDTLTNKPAPYQPLVTHIPRSRWRNLLVDGSLVGIIMILVTILGIGPNNISLPANKTLHTVSSSKAGAADRYEALRRTWGPVEP
ncbi:MAG: serine/threonine protein kinase [Gammaproteobacteria bacterium]|nr:serine/threonine protein kinase [Gammaproteobacteria bacterium]